MIEQWIKINQKIRVSRDNAEVDWYDSNIQDVEGKVFHISIPYQNALPLILDKGDRVEMNIVLQNERIEFKTTVIGRKLDNIPLFTLSFPDKYTRIQQRQFVRLPIMTDIFYAEVKEDDEKQEFLKSCTLDISGGGVRFLVGKIYPKGTKLLLKLVLPIGDKLEEIAHTGKVVRSGNTDLSTAPHVAVEFSGISRRQQDSIARFIIHETLKSKRLSLMEKSKNPALKKNVFQ